MVEPLSSKQITRVRFPSSPPESRPPAISGSPGPSSSSCQSVTDAQAVRADEMRICHQPTRRRQRTFVPVVQAALRHPISVDRVRCCGLSGVRPAAGSSGTRTARARRAAGAAPSCRSDGRASPHGCRRSWRARAMPRPRGSCWPCGQAPFMHTAFESVVLKHCNQVVSRSMPFPRCGFCYRLITFFGT